PPSQSPREHPGRPHRPHLREPARDRAAVHPVACLGVPSPAAANRARRRGRSIAGHASIPPLRPRFNQRKCILTTTTSTVPVVRATSRPSGFGAWTRRVALGSEAAGSWERPAFLGLLIVSAVLYIWNLAV